MKNIVLKAVPLAVAMLLLAGCFEDRPSDKVAEPVIRKQAETDLLDGLEIVNFERSNGQVDPDSANRYKVTYDYRLQLTKPYGEAILSFAQDVHKELAGKAAREPVSDFDFAAVQDTFAQLQYVLAATQWVNAQGDAFNARRDALMAGCQPCTVFWNSADAPAQAEQHRIAFLLAWKHLEELRFEDSFQVGDGVERQAWHYFEKTEKGWVPSN